MGLLMLNGIPYSGFTEPSNIYSTTEREVGVWIDGKTLYEKTFNFGALPNDTIKDVNHNIANVDTIFIVGGYAKNTTNGFVQQLNVPIPYDSYSGINDLSLQYYFCVTSAFIRCFTKGDRSSYDECYVFLQYTKTTDVPGSGKYAPDGSIMHHYSTTEHVIGTWINGKTLYEKTWTGLSAATSGTGWITVNGVDLTGVDKVIHCDLYRTSAANTLVKMPLGESQAYNGTLMVNVVASAFDNTINMITLQYTKSS